MGVVRRPCAHDGGATWTHHELASDLVDAAAFEFQEGNRVSLVLFPHSYAEGSRDARSILYRSTDGGRTWTETSRPGGGNVRFADASHAFVRGDDEGHDDTLRWSEDGGKTFAIHPALRTCAISNDPVFSNTRGVLIAACPAGVFAFRTTDAGVTWKAGARIERDDATGFDFSDPDHGIFTDETTTLVTIDGGITWTSGDITRARNATFMPGTHHAFATDEGSNAMRLLAAEDGKGWRTVATLPVYGTVDFVFSGTSDMLAVVRGSEGSLVYRSKDAGKSFAVMDRP